MVEDGKYRYLMNNDCSAYVFKNADESGANAPVLSSNMVPVKYDGANWIKADYRNPEGEYQWYDYNNGMWANVVVTNPNLVIKDLSGNGYDGTFRGAKRERVNGVIAASFDGVDDYIELPALPETIDWVSGFTVEFSASWEAFNNYSRIMDFSNGNGYQVIALCNIGTNSTFNLHFRQTGNTLSHSVSEETLTLNQKENIKVVYKR